MYLRNNTKFSILVSDIAESLALLHQEAAPSGHATGGLFNIPPNSLKNYIETAEFMLSYQNGILKKLIAKGALTMLTEAEVKAEYTVEQEEPVIYNEAAPLPQEPDIPLQTPVNSNTEITEVNVKLDALIGAVTNLVTAIKEDKKPQVKKTKRGRGRPKGSKNVKNK